jgi:hypothetical protein
MNSRAKGMGYPDLFSVLGISYNKVTLGGSKMMATEITLYFSLQN